MRDFQGPGLSFVERPTVRCDACGVARALSNPCSACEHQAALAAGCPDCGAGGPPGVTCTACVADAHADFLIDPQEEFVLVGQILTPRGPKDSHSRRCMERAFSAANGGLS